MFRDEIRQTRRAYSGSERERILNRNLRKCAHCGRPLTIHTATIEHIIPLSRGGGNNEENLCCLCEECNRVKGNIFYLPSGFYHALRESRRYREIEDLCAAWYRGLPEGRTIDLARFPLLQPSILLSMETDGLAQDFKGHRKRHASDTGTSVEWRIAGRTLQEEAERCSGWKLDAVRAWVDNGPNPQAGIYLLRRVKDGTPLCMAGIRYFEEDGIVRVFLPWGILKPKRAAVMVRLLADILVSTIVAIAGKPVQGMVMASFVPGAFTKFKTEPNPLWKQVSIGELREKETGRAAGEMLTLRFYKGLTGCA